MVLEQSILNPKPRLLPGPQLLHELVADDRTGTATAIEHCAGDGTIERLSYDELHARSDALARRLLSARQTSAPSANGRFIVPMYIPQCLDLYIGQLAILKAGGAFCPVALDAPEERLRFILRDVEATILLTISGSRDKLSQFDDVLVLTADEISPSDDLDSSSRSIAPSDAAYIMLVLTDLINRLISGVLINVQVYFWFYRHAERCSLVSFGGEPGSTGP